LSWEGRVRKSRVALALAAAVALGGCVQTRQFADVQFTPPQGDYRLLVLRTDVTVGALTTGGMVEPRAEWTDEARPRSRLDAWAGRGEAGAAERLRLRLVPPRRGPGCLQGADRLGPRGPR